MASTDKFSTMPHELPEKVDSNHKKILVVSALAVIRDLLKRFLETDGHSVLTARDGVEGLAEAQAHGIDLIVLDGDLPDSVSIRAQFRTETITSHIAVLCVGTRSAKDRFELMDAAESDCYLAMPFSFAQMKRTVARLLR